MKISHRVTSIFVLAGLAAVAQAGDIDASAVLGGAIGGGAGAAIGSAIGGRNGAIVGAGVGGAAGAAIASNSKQQAGQQVVVQRQREVVVVHEDEGCWPPGHCKHGHGRGHGD
jgi:outer membrane lipoprotein SlyB